MSDLLLEVLSHHGQILKVDHVEMVKVPSVLGSTVILRNHASYYGELEIGVLSYRTVGGVERRIAIGTHGIVEVYKNHISVFSHTAEASEDIDVVRARRSKEIAEGLLADGIEKTDGGLRADLALRKALVRLSIASQDEIS